jgi:hypothetical protein
MKTPRPPCILEAWPDLPARPQHPRPPGRENEHLWNGSHSSGSPNGPNRRGSNPDRIPRVCGFSRAAEARTGKGREKEVVRGLAAGSDQRAGLPAGGAAETANPPDLEPEPAPTSDATENRKPGGRDLETQQNDGIRHASHRRSGLSNHPPGLSSRAGCGRSAAAGRRAERGKTPAQASPRARIGRGRNFLRDSCDPSNR